MWTLDWFGRECWPFTALLCTQLTHLMCTFRPDSFFKPIEKWWQAGLIILINPRPYNLTLVFTWIASISLLLYSLTTKVNRASYAPFCHYKFNMAQTSRVLSEWHDANKFCGVYFSENVLSPWSTYMFLWSTDVLLY